MSSSACATCREVGQARSAADVRGSGSHFIAEARGSDSDGARKGAINDELQETAGQGHVHGWRGHGRESTTATRDVCAEPEAVAGVEGQGPKGFCQFVVSLWIKCCGRGFIYLSVGGVLGKVNSQDTDQAHHISCHLLASTGSQ